MFSIYLALLIGAMMSAVIVIIILIVTLFGIKSKNYGGLIEMDKQSLFMTLLAILGSACGGVLIGMAVTSYAIQSLI